MKLDKLLRPLVLPCSLLAVSPLYSQNTDSPEEEGEVFELSPFTVDGSNDVGYRASSTLAGTRLNTRLRDLGASISIVNEQFLQDTASSNIEDVLVYTANTEVGGLGGNFSGAQGAGAGTIIPELQRDQNQGGVTRVRGLAAADLTRDYFLTEIPFDAYNSDRITVQRGANAALFGLGSPGGVVNNSLVKADHNGNRGRVRFQTDQFGTLRSSFRTNQVLVDDTFSILVAGLYEDKKFEQEEANTKDRRFYMAAHWTPLENTRINASLEYGNSDGARPRTEPPNDLISTWFDIGRPTFATPEEAGAWFRTGVGDVAPGQLNNRYMTVIGATSLGATTFYMDPNQPGPTYGGQTYVTQANNPPTATGTDLMMLAPRPIHTIIRLTGAYPDGTPVQEGSAGFFSGGFVERQITDRSIFDYRKHLLDGGASQSMFEFRDIKASIEKTWMDDKVGIELAMSHQDWDEGQTNQLRGGAASIGIFIDTNEFLGTATQDGTPGGALIPNPNYGGVGIASIAENAKLYTNREEYRATGFAEIDWYDQLGDNMFTRILGTSRVTGLVQQRKRESGELYTRDRVNPATVSNALGDGDPANLNAATFRAYQYHALKINGLPEGQTLLDLTSKDQLAGLDIQPIPFGWERSSLPSEGTFRMWDEHSGQFVDVNTPIYTINDNNGQYSAFFASKIGEQIDSTVVIAQQYFWDDNIVLQGSWREDKQDVFGSVRAPGLAGSPGSVDVFAPIYLNGPPSDPTSSVSEQLRSWSAVVHTPDFINEHLPWGTDLSFHFSDASNFQPTPGRRDVYNRGIDPVTGSTEEKGFTVSTLQGKLIARVNWYETGILNNSFEDSSVYAPEGIMLNLARQLDNTANVAQGFTAADAQAVLPPQDVIDLHGVTFDWANAQAESTPNPSRTSTQDFVSEGMEIEISYFPVTNWHTQISISKQETITDNTNPVVEEFQEAFVDPNWIESSFAQNYYIDDAGTETLAEYAIRTMRNPILSSAAQDGRPTIEQREWRAVASTSYRFLEDSSYIPSWLGTFTVGGSVRWEDEVGVGFRVGTNELGEYVPDPNMPLYGGEQVFVDAFLRSEYELEGDRSFSVQLNVRDLTDNDDLVPIFANPDNSRIYRIQEGRVISATATYNF